MPKVTYYKPNRSHPRHFTIKDLTRLTKYVERDSGLSKQEIFVYMAVALGFGTLLCKAARGIASMLTIMFWLEKITATLALGQLTTLIIQVLIKAKLVAPVGVNILLAIAIAAITLIDGIVNMMPTIAGDIALLREITGTINGMCAKVKELSGEVVDGVCDATGEACTTLRELGDQAAFQLKSDTEKAMEILDMERPETWF